MNRAWSYQNQATKGSYCDLYIVGTTNVGKSSLFNTLLDSDLCSLAAVNRVEKAMTSPVPGTTLNLLKFPMSRPDPSRMSNRRQRYHTSYLLKIEIVARNTRIIWTFVSTFCCASAILMPIWIWRFSSVLELIDSLLA